jgi:hypothetical protein
MRFILIVFATLTLTGCSCLENCPAQANLDCGHGVKANPKTLECPP